MESCERMNGHDLVLEAWPSIVDAVPSARLLIVGDGSDLPRLKRRVAEERLEGVEFTGRVGDSERDALYRRASVFLFPSRQEGFGLAAVEAAEAGLPVVALRGTVMEELFPLGSGVELIAGINPRPLADATIDLLSNRRRAREMGAAARDRVYQLFLEEHFSTRFDAAVAPLLWYSRCVT
jgi:phosphatidylinositol alpha-1,6-mannosyltransferase